jgi:hypothetical protein
MRKTRQYFFLWALPVVAFLACALYLQTKKVPWVDECYTYYGITHVNAAGFFDSICSGVNFSPPLYFFLNWVVQLVFHMPIEALRIESALWITTGCLLIFLRCAKAFGLIAAFLGFSMVLLQSGLLIEQALEARHYGMFFACSCLVLFCFPQDSESNSAKRKTLYFVSLLALGLTHYLGIVFCIIAGLTRLWFLRREPSKLTLLLPELLSSVILFATYLSLLSTQSSHLGNWFRPNDLESLLNIYFDTLKPLTLLVAIVPILMLRPTNSRKIQEVEKREINNSIPLPLLAVSVLWVLAPLFFWILSHVSPLNLLKERYFIPKEAAVMIILSFFLQTILRKCDHIKPKPSKLLIIAPFLASLGICALSTKRILFGLDPSINYHHKLLLSETICKNPLPKLCLGDHLFFPNHYAKGATANIQLIVSSKNLKEVYRRFNSSLTTQSIPDCDGQSYILLMDEKITRTNHIIPAKWTDITFDKTMETNGLIHAYQIEITETN